MPDNMGLPGLAEIGEASLVSVLPFIVICLVASLLLFVVKPIVAAWAAARKAEARGPAGNPRPAPAEGAELSAMEARFDRLEMMLGQQAELSERCFAEIRATLGRHGKLLEDRRRGEIALHQKIDGVQKQVHENGLSIALIKGAALRSAGTGGGGTDARHRPDRGALRRDAGRSGSPAL